MAQLRVPLRERLVRVSSEITVCRTFGKDPYGWLPLADLELAANNGLLEDDRHEQPYRNDQ